MATIRKLTAEETQAIEDKGKTKRQLIEVQYDAILAGYESGEYGEAEPEDGESKLLLRKRLKEAATRRGVSLTFLRTSGSTFRFKVEENEDEDGGLRLLLSNGSRSGTSLEDLEDIPF
jgi:hypothetical protein